MASRSWLTATSADWNTTTAWTGGVAPGIGAAAGDSATIAVAGTYSVTLGLADSVECAAVTLSDAAATLDNLGTLLPGTLALDAGLMTLGDGTGAGTIANGLIAPAAGTMFFNNGTLSGDTWEGVLDMSASGGRLHVASNLAMEGAGGIGPGTIELTGANALLATEGNNTISDAVINFAATSGIISVSSSDTLTLASTTTIEASGMTGGAQQISQSGTLINQGQIVSNLTFGGPFEIVPTLINLGGITAENTSLLVIQPQLTGTDTNDGSIVVDGGNLQIGGPGAPATSDVVGTGSVTMENGAFVDLNGVSVASGQTFDFGAGSNLLEIHGAPSVYTTGLFDAVIEGFGGSDTIDVKPTLASVVWTQGTGQGSLTLNNGTSVVGTFDLVGTYAQSNFNLSPDDGSTGTDITFLPCFAAGTRLLTDRGEVPVEHLRLGDRLAASGGRLARIVWLGQRRVDCRRSPRPVDAWPIRVHAGAFADGLPVRGLRLSPDHAVFVDAMLVPARHLVNDSTIVQEPVDEVTYYHVELAAHDVILAEGLPCESYLDTGNRVAFSDGKQQQGATARQAC
jgi:hypothetical protein